MDLEQLRAQVDLIDEQLVDLLNRRAQLSLEIFQEKQRLGIPIYHPEREQQVLHHVLQRNLGPLDSEQLTGIFQHIIETCRTLQQKRKGIEYGNCHEK